MKKTTATAIALCFQLPETESGARWLELIPAGRFTGRDGRSWINDSPEAVIARAQQDGRDIPLDENHATELQAAAGNPSPAAGWFAINDLEIRDGAIWGLMQLNGHGEALINDKHYKYYSPAFLFDAESRVTQLRSVALTNRQNLYNTALNAEQHPDVTHQENPTMKALLLALGLAEGAAEAEAIARVTALNAELNASKTALNAQQTTLQTSVPLAQYQQLEQTALNAQAELTQLKAAQFQGQAVQVVDEAIAAGKVAPASREFYLGLCRDEAGLNNFKTHIQQAPVIAQPGTVVNGKQGEEQTALNAEELQVASMMGLSAEQFKESKDALNR